MLTALAALAALDQLPPGRRVVCASLVGLPYLGASFLAQSAFKETAMALLVLAFAVALTELGREPPPGDRQPHPRRAMLVALILFVIASVFVYSLPGLVWFAIAVPIWLALELGTGRLRIDVDELRAEARRHRRVIVAVAVAVVAVGALSAAQLSGFVDKVGQVQESGGRLELAGLPRRGPGDLAGGRFPGRPGGGQRRLPGRGTGAAGGGDRRPGGDPPPRLRAPGRGGGGGARVRGRAAVRVDLRGGQGLAVLAPLVVLAGLGALLAPRVPGVALSTARYALGAVVAVVLAGSTLLALRAAPVGFDQRGDELESLAGLVRGRSVAFLGVDRFAGYWLRGTLMRSPGGYVPEEVEARPKKVWQQGLAMDLDTLSPRRLDQFDYAITTRAAYQSTAAAELRDGGHNALLRALAALGADAPAWGDRQERHPGSRSGLRRARRVAGWPGARARRR